jgi:flagellar protein FlaF
MSKNQKPGRPTPSNPYAAAAGAYDQHAQQHTPDQRETEARVLLKAVKAFQDIQKRWDQVSREELDECLKYNRQIWMMFVDTAIEDTGGDRPLALRNNIANLGVFIFNHTLDILADPKPGKLDILIDINREIAAGLMTKPKAEEKAKS